MFFAVQDLFKFNVFLLKSTSGFHCLTLNGWCVNFVKLPISFLPRLLALSQWGRLSLVVDGPCGDPSVRRCLQFEKLELFNVILMCSGWISRHSCVKWSWISRHPCVKWSWTSRHSCVKWSWISRHSCVKWSWISRHSCVKWSWISRHSCVNDRFCGQLESAVITKEMSLQPETSKCFQYS